VIYILGSKISYPRSTSSARIRLAASTPSHIGISGGSTQLWINTVRKCAIVRWSNIAAWKYPGPYFSQAPMASSPFVVASTLSFTRSSCALSSLRAIGLSKHSTGEGWGHSFRERVLTFSDQNFHPCKIPFVGNVLDGLLHGPRRYGRRHLGCWVPQLHQFLQHSGCPRGFCETENLLRAISPRGTGGVPFSGSVDVNYLCVEK
jgi:hypothetical protein